MKRIATLVVLMAMAAPARAQLQGREIDLNQKQGWIGWEQAEYFLIEDRLPKGWGGWDGAPKSFPKPEGQGGEKWKPEDEVTGYTDDPSERAQAPQANGQANPPGEQTPDGNDDYDGE